jgi:hypothetical protein
LAFELSIFTERSRGKEGVELGIAGPCAIGDTGKAAEFSVFTSAVLVAAKVRVGVTQSISDLTVLATQFDSVVDALDIGRENKVGGDSNDSLISSLIVRDDAGGGGSLEGD